MQKIARDFLARIEGKLPQEKAARPFVVATIGLPGSGRTTVARKIAEALPRAVLVQANSARYLLKEAALPWGENVRQVLKIVAKDLLSKSYGVVFDGNAADEEDRKNIQDIASQSGAKVFYVRINVDPSVVKEREETKYGSSWVSRFEDFRVNTTEKMLANIDERAKLHAGLKSQSIPGLIGEIDNNGTMDELEKQIGVIIEKIRTAL